MEEKIAKLEKEIELIKSRNKRVEADKAWETSWWRRIIIAIITYVLIALYMVYLNIAEPWLNALVPTVGFILSTFTIGWVKNIWLGNNYR